MTTENDNQPKVYNTEQEILDSELPLGEQIDLLLDMGLSKKQLLRRGFSDPLIRQRLKKRAKMGKESTREQATEIAAVIRGTEKITPFHTIEIISNLLDGNEQQRAIFKAGMLVPILGMQMFNEGQKSFASYMNAMKQENTEATMKAMAMNQDAAHTAALESAQMVGAQIAASQKETAIASSANPMKAMMADTMMPLMKGMMNMLSQRMMPGMGQQPGTLPTGWTREKS